MSTVEYLYNEWDALAAIFALVVFFAMVLYGLVVVLTGELGMTARTDAIHMVLAFGAGAFSVMLLQIVLTAAGTHRPRRWGRHPHADWITTLERRKRL